MATSFPVIGLLDALIAWQGDAEPERTQRLTAALEALATATASRGIWLEVPAIGTQRVELGYGTLADPGVAATAPKFDLRVSGRPEAIGWVALDARDADVSTVVNAIELAVEAAWSREELRQTAERLEALDAATRGIAGVQTVDRVLQLIVDRVRDLIDAEYAALGIVDDHGVMEQFVTSGITAEQRRRIGPLPRGRGLLGLIVRENRSYRIPDIAVHESSVGFPPNHPPMTSFLGVPIQVKGRSVGNFYLANKRTGGGFSASDEHLVELFALHAGVAIENARLHEQVRRLAVVDERTRIGRDLHDGIIQVLYGVGLSLEDVPDLMDEDQDEAARRVDRAIDSLNLTIRDLRNFIFGLRSELVARGGLVAGLATLADEVRLNTMIDVDLDAPDDLGDVPVDRRAEVLQIAREALSNVTRHSGATIARIRVARDGDDLELAVTDNGRGFSVADPIGGDHQGLRNMRGRATDLGGTLTLESAPGSGTRIIARIPFEDGGRTDAGTRDT